MEGLATKVVEQRRGDQRGVCGSPLDRVVRGLMECRMAQPMQSLDLFSGSSHFREHLAKAKDQFLEFGFHYLFRGSRPRKPLRHTLVHF